MKRLLLALPLALSSCIVPPVYAQSNNCAPTVDVEKRLSSKYSESVVFNGLGKLQNQLVWMRLWLSEDSGSWTITSSDAKGTTCVNAVGEEGQIVSEPILNNDSEL